MRKHAPCFSRLLIISALTAGFLLIPAPQSTASAGPSASALLSLRLTARKDHPQVEWRFPAVLGGGHPCRGAQKGRDGPGPLLPGRPRGGTTGFSRSGDGGRGRGDHPEGDCRVLEGPGHRGGDRFGPSSSIQLRKRDRRHPHPPRLQRHCLPRRGQGPGRLQAFHQRRAPPSGLRLDRQGRRLPGIDRRTRRAHRSSR